MRHFHLRRDLRTNSNGGLRAEILEDTLRHLEVPEILIWKCLGFQLHHCQRNGS